VNIRKRLAAGIMVGVASSVIGLSTVHAGTPAVATPSTVQVVPASFTPADHSVSPAWGGHEHCRGGLVWDLLVALLWGRCFPGLFG
jgi:hypothetical protein